jgi:hypothetical protein
MRIFGLKKEEEDEENYVMKTVIFVFCTRYY